MSEAPNERSTLLAKSPRRRKYSTLNGVEEDAAGETLASASAARINSDADEANFDDVASLVSSDISVIDLECSCYCGPWRFYLVEPMIFILLFAYNLSSTVMKNQIMYQTCTAILGYNPADCKLLGTNDTSNHTREIETAVQPYAARVFMVNNIIEGIAPAICGTFIGAWSDRFGRKPLILTAFIGYAMYYGIATIIAYMAINHLVSPWYYLLAVLPHAMLGGSITYSVAALCYITDVTDERQRPYRLVIYEAVIYIGLMIGSLTAGYIYEATSTTTIFAISAGSIAVAALIIACFMAESLNVRGIMPLTMAENIDSNVGAGRLQQLFDVKLVKDVWQTCFKLRALNDRAIVWLTMIVMLTGAFILRGGGTVFYLFIRAQFHWTIKEYTSYETFSILVAVIGNLLGIWLLRKILKVSLTHLAILSFLSHAACSFMQAFAFANWQMYLAMGLGALRSISTPMCRTIITNIVPANELGKIFSFTGALEELTTFIASPVFTLIYSITLKSFPGCFELICANLFFLNVAFLLAILRKKSAFPEHYDALLN